MNNPPKAFPSYSHEDKKAKRKLLTYPDVMSEQDELRMNNPPKAFLSYSHKNKKAKRKLLTYLDVMLQQDELTIWHDREMVSGDVLREEILKNLSKSDILLCLVSAASLASRACKEELEEALKANITIVPIIFEHCDWKNYHKLEGLLALPEDGKPINTWVPESEGWQNVVEGIRNTVEKVQQPPPLYYMYSRVVFAGVMLFRSGRVQRAPVKPAARLTCS